MMRHIFIFALIWSLVPHALAGFHLLTRNQHKGFFDCSRRGGCRCEYQVEWRMGAVPAQDFSCGAFMNDRYFPQLIEQGGNWNTWFADICGSGPVDMYVVNGGNNLEVWKHGANPGNLLAKCYRQNSNTITCGNPGDPVCTNGYTKLEDVWVCAETNLCS